jgi:tetratricopeptide (TPR) repeat protein
MVLRRFGFLTGLLLLALPASLVPSSSQPQQNRLANSPPPPANAGQTDQEERRGIALADQGQNQEALKLFLRAMAAARARGDRRAQARIAVQEGLVYRGMRNLAQARPRFEEALKLIPPAGDATVEAKAHNGLGLVADDEGRLHEAFTEYHKALEAWPKAGDPAGEAQTLSNLGQTLLKVGQAEEALVCLNRALTLLDQKDQREVRFEVLDGAGLAHQDLGSRTKSLLMYELALKLASTPVDEARIRNRLGIVYRDEKDLDRATEELTKARSLAVAAGDVQWEAFSLADLAHIENLRKQNEDALRDFDKAFSLLQAMPDALPKSSILFGRAEVLRDLGLLEDAIEAALQSISLVEAVRSNLVDPGQRVSFFSTRQRCYELYVSLLMAKHRAQPRKGFDKQAFEASDRSHSRSLLDDVAGESPTATQGRTLREIQREIGPDTAILAYALGSRESFLWFVTRDRIASFNLPCRDLIEDASSRAWQRLSTAGDGPEVEELSRMLLPDQVERLLPRRLLISPDGRLHLIPFSMLHEPGGRSLLLNHEVSSLPSASFLVGLRHKLSSRPLAPKQLATLADPVFEADDPRLSRLGMGRAGVSNQLLGGHLERLPSSRREAEKILGLVSPSKRFQAFDFQASRRVILSPQLASFQMLHITTHHIADSHPDFSGLVLSRFDEHGRPQNGFVRASEIYSLHLPAELVVLSACGTGLGPDVRGEGPMGMARAFLHAGARRVVVSLWDVEDDATTELMARFYRGMLHERLTPAGALRSAQLSIATDPEWRRSRSWAAFVLQGEPN